VGYEMWLKTDCGSQRGCVAASTGEERAKSLASSRGQARSSQHGKSFSQSLWLTVLLAGKNIMADVVVVVHDEKIQKTVASSQPAGRFFIGERAYYSGVGEDQKTL